MIFSIVQQREQMFFLRKASSTTPQTNLFLRGDADLYGTKAFAIYGIGNACMVDKMILYANILPQDKVGKTLLKNGSYDVSLENTTVCIRKLASKRSREDSPSNSS